MAKAEGDWLAAGVLFRARNAPNYDVACFLCQQSAEKYLKARLTEAGVAFRRTHDLVALLDLCLPIEPGWASVRDPAAALTDYAVEFRYPGKRADKARAKQALADSQRIRDAARRSFGLRSGGRKRTAGRSAAGRRPSKGRKP